MRQIHHWAAMIFVAAMMVHLLRVFFTGAFRKPRELNWVIGCLLLLLGTLEGFTGYSLPDDLLSGTGIRAADGFMKSMPVVGTYMSFFLFGGEFPGDSIIPRLYTVHVLLIPGILLALIARAHAAARLPQAHPVARARPHRAERRRLPDAAGLHGQGRRLLLRRLRRPGPDGRADDHQPGLALRALQPGRGDGGLPARLVHGLARRRAADHARLGDPPLGHCTLSWNVFLPIIVLPGLMFTILMMLPVHRALDHRRQARAPPARSVRATPRRARR